MPSSCDLLLKSNQFQEWQTGLSSCLLRVVGHPGAGKTHLATAIHDQLEKSQELSVYFFCKSGSKDRGMTSDVLRTLLSQLLKLQKSAYDIAVPLYQESGRAEADSVSEVEQILGNILVSGLHVLHIVIDAVDELSDRSQLYAALQSLLSQSYTVVKILVTGRNEDDIVKAFAQHPWLGITTELIEVPIEMYIQARLSDNSTLVNSKLKRAVYERINHKVDGLWLYAKLLVDAIADMPSASAIERQLCQLPHGLSETYFQILERHAEKLTS
ncbi:hypothetical protein MMC18_002907 [Xylographa bjoerkii]|nr:hypothetical protein [Xylographa bjoerkii]